jgi:hypothetical protein
VLHLLAAVTPGAVVSEFWPTVVDGLVIGAIYALVALG